MIELGVAGISTILGPSTAGSVTTEFAGVLAGFLEGDTLGTRRSRNHSSSAWRGRFYRQMGMDEMRRHADTVQKNFFWWSY